MNAICKSLLVISCFFISYTFTISAPVDNLAMQTSHLQLQMNPPAEGLTFPGWDPVFRLIHMTGRGMQPTIDHGDILLVRRLGQGESPGPGDIVAFRPFADFRSPPYVKRVVALPGDTVDFIENRFVINGVVLDDDFSRDPIISFGDVDFPVTVEEGHFFVLGDNRNGSFDSRFSSVGNVSTSSMYGVAILRIWPRIG